MAASKVRESNMELLRLLAMFLILVVHSDFFALGKPDNALVLSRPVEGFTRLFIEAVAFICVDVFVLLSGWYRIRFSLKGLIKFLYQCLFFSIGIYMLLVLTGLFNFSLSTFAECFFVNNNSYWFVKAYILLFILSPALNYFVDHCDKQMYKLILLLFFIFQCLYGWLSSGAAFLMLGNSTCSFIGLYLLSAYVNKYRPRWSTLGWRAYLWVFVGICLLESAMPMITAYVFNNDSLTASVLSRVYAYSSPLVILSSLSFLLTFASIKVFYNKVINWIAISCFAACLLHGHHCVVDDYFASTIRTFYANSSYSLFLVKTFGFCVLFFLAAIPLDKVRMITFKYIEKVLFANNKSNENRDTYTTVTK